MFKINDNVMYGMVGACKIVDIKKEKITSNIEKDYYVLNHVFTKNIIIKIPVDNKKIPMRKLISKEEVILLINNIGKEKNIWIEDEKSRSAKFKSILKSGKCEELMELVSCIYLDKEYKKTIGKKVGKSDADIMEAAEKLINEEFATVLEIYPEEVSTYIQSNISEKILNID